MTHDDYHWLLYCSPEQIQQYFAEQSQMHRVRMKHLIEDAIAFVNALKKLKEKLL